MVHWKGHCITGSRIYILVLPLLEIFPKDFSKLLPLYEPQLSHASNEILAFSSKIIINISSSSSIIDHIFFTCYLLVFHLHLPPDCKLHTSIYYSIPTV